MSSNRITRREMLKVTTIGGLGFALGFGGCTTIPKDMNWGEVPDKDFLHIFDRWFISNQLYRGINPNLKLTQSGKEPTYRDNVFSQYGSTPGLCYTSDEMYAAADGIALEWKELRTGRAGGLMLELDHGIMEERYRSTRGYSRTFTTYYAHLGSVDETIVNSPSPIIVRRGQLIGRVSPEYRNIAKLMFVRGGTYADPDHYGSAHGFMNAYQGTNIPIINIHERHLRQCELFTKLHDSLPYETQYQIRLWDREHRRGHYWDLTEKFEYLELLYEKKPQLFSPLSVSSFTELRTEFYENQPLVLTLPLKA